MALWDSLKPIAELDASGSVTAVYRYAEKYTTPSFVERDGQRYRVISDHLGSPRLVVNAADSANRPVLGEYGAFGEVNGSGLGWMPFGFAGGTYDVDTGLVRFGARDYDPVAGRWTGKDPAGFAGGDSNLYAYVGNEPVNRKDPTGLYTEVIFWEPVGFGPSSFGHVSIVIDGVSYSWGPSGMDIRLAEDYIARNQRMRSGRGIVLGLSGAQERALEQSLRSHGGSYSAFKNNCTDSIEKGLRDVGARDEGLDSLLPTGLARSFGELAIGQTFYPGASRPGVSTPWSIGVARSFWDMY